MLNYGQGIQRQYIGQNNNISNIKTFQKKKQEHYNVKRRKRAIQGQLANINNL